MKKSINKRKVQNLVEIEEYKNFYREYFLDLFLENVIIEGEEVTDEAKRFILTELWFKGCVGGSLVLEEVKDIQTLKDNLIYTPVAPNYYNIYNAVSKAQLINNRGVSFISQDTKDVNKNVVIIYARRTHLPIKQFVDFYANKLATIENTIDINLNAHKMPLGVAIDENNGERRQDLANRLLSGEGIIFLGVDDINTIKSVIPGAPFIIDKLEQEKKVVLNECLTRLGINNSNIEKAERLITDEVNSNNELINLSGACILDEIKEGFERCNKILGSNIKVYSKLEKIEKENEKKQKQEDPEEQDKEGREENV